MYSSQEIDGLSPFVLLTRFHFLFFLVLDCSFSHRFKDEGVPERNLSLYIYRERERERERERKEGIICVSFLKECRGLCVYH
jgi:hypothetical protein